MRGLHGRWGQFGRGGTAVGGEGVLCPSGGAGGEEEETGGSESCTIGHTGFRKRAQAKKVFGETVKTVSGVPLGFTGLKPGVNQMRGAKTSAKLVRMLFYIAS